MVVSEIKGHHSNERHVLQVSRQGKSKPHPASVACKEQTEWTPSKNSDQESQLRFQKQTRILGGRRSAGSGYCPWLSLGHCPPGSWCLIVEHLARKSRAQKLKHVKKPCGHFSVCQTRSSKKRSGTPHCSTSELEIPCPQGTVVEPMGAAPKCSANLPRSQSRGL